MSWSCSCGLAANMTTKSSKGEQSKTVEIGGCMEGSHLWTARLPLLRNRVLYWNEPCSYFCLLAVHLCLVWITYSLEPVQTQHCAWLSCWKGFWFVLLSGLLAVVLRVSGATTMNCSSFSVAKLMAVGRTLQSSMFRDWFLMHLCLALSPSLQKPLPHSWQCTWFCGWVGTSCGGL